MTIAHQLAPGRSGRVQCGRRMVRRARVGVGDRFEADVLRAVDECAGTPSAWAVWLGWERDPVVRTKGVGGFPHRVVYFVDDDNLRIVAVAHAKRRPGFWREQVTST